MSEMKSSDKERFLTMARLAEQAERFDDMVDNMTKVIKVNGILNNDEQNLLSIAFKNVIGVRRSAWRILTSFLTNADPADIRTQITQEYMSTIENEIKTICENVLGLLDNYLIPASTGSDAEVRDTFYHKMKGDYYRYMAEIMMNFDDPKRIEIVKLAEESYEKAFMQANEHLAPTDPIRLGVALNYSVFFFEIKNSVDRACQLARSAFDASISELDRLSGDSYKDSTLIMQLLRDNLTLWASDLPAEGETPEEMPEHVKNMPPLLNVHGSPGTVRSVVDSGQANSNGN